jgi:hypothetical protein
MYTVRHMQMLNRRSICSEPFVAPLWLLTDDTALSVCTQCCQCHCKYWQDMCRLVQLPSSLHTMQSVAAVSLQIAVPLLLATDSAVLTACGITNIVSALCKACSRV